MSKNFNFFSFPLAMSNDINIREKSPYSNHYRNHIRLKLFETFKNKFLVPFRLLPKEGLSAEKLAFSVTLGIVTGIFPVLGTTTTLSILLTLLFRQNILVVQSVQWALAPVQLLLIIPFMKLGAYILQHLVVQVNLAHIKLAFQPGMLAGIKTIGVFHLYGIFTWALLAIPISILFYFYLLRVFRKRNPKD